MSDGKPNTCKHKPNDVAQHAEAASSDIVLVLEFFSAYCFLAKREEGELADHEAGFSPWDANDG